MDEQNDQAVLELEEIETGTDYNYLSILREMQQSLSDDEESTDILKMTDDEAGLPTDLPTELTSKDVAPTSLDSHPETNSHLIAIEGETENVQTADYFADAPTQPLPELPAEFNNHSLSSESSAESSIMSAAEAKTYAETDASLSNNSVASNEDSFSRAIDSLETAGQSGLKESVEKGAELSEINDPAFDDFAELSPILFDADETAGIIEPDFDSQLFVESPTEMTTLETLTDNSPADSSQATQTGAFETVPDELPSVADEMPMNLTFSEMFGTDSSESKTALTPPIEFGEEAEFETAPLPQHLGSEDFASAESLSEEPAISSSEQHLAEQNLAAELGAKSNELAIEDNLADLGLPDSMFLADAESNFTFAPSLIFSDAEPQEKGRSEAEMTEPDLSEIQQVESETNNLDLSVPWFLQEELTTKHSSSEESLPDPFLAEDNFAGERATTELNTTLNEMSAAPPVAENNNEAEEAQAEPTSHEEIVGKNGFKRNISLPEADAMSETFSFESSDINFSETQYPEDLPENFLATPLENESGVLPDNLSDEIPEALLLKNSETQAPENDSVGLDAPPEPQFEDLDLSVSAPQAESALIAESPEEPETANQNTVPENYNQLGKASFLEERFVIFKLDDILYALPAVNVAEIGQLLPITPLPFVPSWFLGITHLRGDILSVVGLRELWQKTTAVPHKAKILIVHSEKQSLTIALVVDAVREMRHVAPEEIIAGESYHDSHFAHYQIGTVDYDGQNLCLLNAEKLLETLRS